MHEIDLAVKKTCVWYPDCFMDLFYGRNRNVKLMGVEDAQIQIPEHRADKIWRVREGKKEAALILEAITEPDRRDFPALALKNTATRVTLRVPVITVLVYVRRGKYATFPDSYTDEIGDLKTSFTFSRVLLWEHKDRILSGELKELAPFLVLLEDDPTPEILQKENQLIEQVAEPERRADLRVIAGIIAARQFSEEIIRQYFKLEPPMLLESTIYSQLLDEKYHQGLDEGESKGEIKGKSTLLQKLLEKRFGTLPLEAALTLRKLGNDQLEQLAASLFDMMSLEDLRAWLRHHNGQVGAA